MGQESTIGYVKRLTEGYERVFDAPSPHSDDVAEIERIADCLSSTLKSVCWHIDQYVVEFHGILAEADINALQGLPSYIAHMVMIGDTVSDTSAVYLDAEGLLL